MTRSTLQSLAGFVKFCWFQPEAQHALGSSGLRVLAVDIFSRAALLIVQHELSVGVELQAAFGADRCRSTTIVGLACGEECRVNGIPIRPFEILRNRGRAVDLI